MIEFAIQRYQHRALLGEGGVGRVHLVYDTLDEREVALKELLTGSHAELKQEFWWMTRLRHPNLLEVYDFGLNEAGQAYFTMEVVEGESLGALLPCSEEMTKSVLMQLCLALRQIHQHGLVHGDLKPENIRYTSAGKVKLMDFGMMSRVGQPVPVRGTPAYVAPEVLQGAPIDQRADLYALGVIAYELLSGNLPFSAPTVGQMLRAQLEGRPPSLSLARPNLDPLWERLVMKLMARDPARRFQSATDVLAALGEGGPDVAGGAHDEPLLMCSPFIARDEELAAFDAALAEIKVREDEGPMWVTGPGGIGKTRLLQEFGFRTQLADVPMLRAEPRSRSGLPYEPFALMLRQAMLSGGTARKLLETYGQDLRALVPDLVGGDAGPRLEPQQEKRRIQSGLSGFLEGLARERGLVLMLDRWHEADPPSQELLEVLQRQLARKPILIVIASQDPAPVGVESHAIEPLNLASVSRMLGAMLGVEHVPPDFAGQLAELTGSVPFLLEACLRHLVTHGLLPVERGAYVLAALPPESLPADVQALLSARLADLSTLALQILELAAVIERDFPLDLLLRLLPEAAPEALYEELGTLETAALLLQWEGVYQAGQSHLLDALRQAMPPAKLTGLHLAVAQSLEAQAGALAGGIDEGTAVQLAHHLLAGQAADETGVRRREAIAYALRAAQHMATLYATDQALDLLARGWALLPEPASTDGEGSTRLGYLTLRGDIHRLRGEVDKAEPCHHEGLALSESLARPVDMLHQLVGLGILRQLESQYEAGLVFLQQALDIVARCGDETPPREHLRCLTTFGRSEYQLGHRDIARTIYEKALAVARAHQDRSYLGECLGFLGLLLISEEPSPGEAFRVFEGLDYMKQAIEIKESIGDRLGLNDALMLQGNAQMLLGQLAGAEDSFRKNLALSQELGSFEDEVVAHLNLALVALDRGEFERMLACARLATELASTREQPFHLGLASSLEARALLEAGQFDRPLPMIMGSLEGARQAENTYWELFALVHLVEIQHRLGLVLDASASHEKALALQSSTGIDEFAALLILQQGALALTRGEGGPAAECYREVIARSELRQAQLLDTLASMGMAEAALLGDEVAQAKTWVARAQERAHGCGARSLAVECQFMAGRVAEAEGDTLAADSLYQHAQDEAHERDLVDLEARATYRRAILQYPSPVATKLLDRARTSMQVLVERLESSQRLGFLALHNRRAILQGLFPHEMSTALQPVSGDPPGGKLQTLDEGFQRLRTLKLKELDYAQTIASSSDAGFAINLALANMLEITRACRAEMIVAEGGRIRSQGMRQATDLAEIDDDWELYEDAVEQAMGTGESIYWPQIRVLPNGLALPEPRMVLVLPLLENNVPLGVILILGRPQQALMLRSRELDSAKVLTQQLVVFLLNLRLQAEWHDKNQRLEILYHLSSTVSSTLVESEVLEIVLQLSLEITKAERSCVLLLNDSETLEFKAGLNSSGLTGEAVLGNNFSHSICRRVLASGEAVAVADTQNDSFTREQKSIMDLDLRSVMCVPLRVKARYLGVLYVDSRVMVNAFVDKDLDLLKAVASHASIAIENAHLYQMATIDFLTGLYFRSYFEQRLREELIRARRYNTCISVMMMDVDHFKKFNDTYGHGVGDSVLKHVAEIVRSGLREGIDLPSRYGGEEIVVLLPETDSAGAAICGERIRRKLSEARLSAGGFEDLQVNMSIGVASYPAHGATNLELLEAADQALYISKREGRNRLTIYTGVKTAEAT